MGVIPKAWNEAVQKKGGLFNTVKSVFKEEGLIKYSRDETLTNMQKKAESEFKNSLAGYAKNAEENGGTAAAFNNDGIKVTKEREAAFARESDKNRTDFDSYTMTKASPWKNTTDEQADKVRSVAAKNATMKNTTASTSNADEILGLYNSALKATKRKAKVKAVGNTVKNYYTKPFEDERIGTGIARAGVTALGVGTAGAITYSLSGAGNKSYANNDGNGSYDY